jgi:hypothetical protein
MINSIDQPKIYDASSYSGSFSFKARSAILFSIIYFSHSSLVYVKTIGRSKTFITSAASVICFF